MSFTKGKISNLTSMTIKDDKKLGKYLADVDFDLQNLFKIAAPYYQFGTGTGFSVIIYSGTGYTNVAAIGGWRIGQNTLSSTNIVLNSSSNTIYTDNYSSGVSGWKLFGTGIDCAFATFTNITISKNVGNFTASNLTVLGNVGGFSATNFTNTQTITSTTIKASTDYLASDSTKGMTTSGVFTTLYFKNGLLTNATA